MVTIRLATPSLFNNAISSQFFLIFLLNLISLFKLSICSYAVTFRRYRVGCVWDPHRHVGHFREGILKYGYKDRIYDLGCVRVYIYTYILASNIVITEHY